MNRLLLNFTKATVILALLFAVSCQYSATFGDGIKGDGNWDTQNRTLEGDFDEIKVSDGVKLVLIQSNNKMVTVITDHNLQSMIKTSIEDGVLTIESTEDYSSSQRTTVEVSLPSLIAIRAEGGVSVVNNNKFVAQDLVVEISGGSSTELNLEIENLILKASSGSSLEIEGKAMNLDASASSGSSIECDKLIANNVKAQSSSGSSIEVYPVVSLIAKASSGSSVEFANNPQTIEKESSSGGSVSSK